MSHVATLICDPEKPSLDAAALERVRAVLPGSGAADWLDEGIAADIPFSPDGAADQRAPSQRAPHQPTLADAIRATLGGLPADVVVQATAHRRKRLLLADMDSTMIGQECIDELADHAGIKAHVAAITERAMRGEIDFEPALRERVALLKGLPATVVDEVIRDRITLMPGGRALIQTMRKAGAYTCLVSGGFTPFTSRIASLIGFDENRANTLVVQNGRFAGTVAEPILGSAAKLDTLREISARLGLDPLDSLAVGDGANDIPMLQEAGLGVAYRAKPKTAEAAAARIDHGDLTALLYMQGYRRADFVE